MSTLSNQIEAYLKQMLAASANGMLELKRSDLAGSFMCVPSQINYVLDTRFSPSQGYMVESRRGGGGYVRIIRLAMDQENDIASLLSNAKDRRVSATSGEKLVERLVEEEFLTRREGMLVKALTEDSVLKAAADPEALRSSLLNSVLQLLLRDDFTELGNGADKAPAAATQDAASAVATDSAGSAASAVSTAPAGGELSQPE